MNLATIREFITESNAIEGIHAATHERLYLQHQEAFMEMLLYALENIMPDPLYFHQLLMDGILDSYGEYRKVYVTVGNYKPPAPGLVPITMHNWHNALKQDFLDLKVLSQERCWHYHHWFETIHPFEDGNGRVGRLILAQLFLMNGYDLPIIKADNRLEYYASIEKWRQDDFR